MLKMPVQHDCVGRDTGMDAMAVVLGGIDCAATSVGFPICNMHTKLVAEQERKQE